MHQLNAARSFRLSHAIGAGALSVMLTFCLMPVGSMSAEASTKEELQAQADSIYSNIDALQTQLNQAQSDLADARQASEDAHEAMSEAAERADWASKRQSELESELGERVAYMYRSGSTSLLDVLLGSASFQDFLTGMDYYNRIAQQNAQMVQESKDVRAEADASKAEYERQKQIADEQVALSESLVAQIQSTQSQLTEEAGRITSEIAEIEAEEAAEAEAAAQAAAAAEAAQAAAAASSDSSSSEAGASVDTGTGQFCNPCPEGTLSSGFGYRDFDGAFHKGIDLAASEGTPYYAAESGTVIYATYDGGYNGGAGNWIVISHGNGLVTKYMHSSAVYVRVGDQVTRGQNIGAVGNTGDSYGAHLHFQVELNGTAVSPYNYL